MVIQHPYFSIFIWISSVQFSSVAQLCPTLCDPMDYCKPGFPVHHQLPSCPFKSEMPSNHLILCLPLLLLPLIFTSIRVFSNESVLPIRCPKYWGFSFSISLPNVYSGLISFSMDWLWKGFKLKEGSAAWLGIYVYLWLIHVEVWQKTTKFCKAIILQ